MTDFPRLLTALHDAGVRFIVVGGAAATAHGSARLTLDLDIVYDRSVDNVQRLVSALSPHQPYLRGAPPGLPFTFDAPTLVRGLNFTLTTAVGWIDLLGEIAGGGTYQELMPFTIEMALFTRATLVRGVTTSSIVGQRSRCWSHPDCVASSSSQHATTARTEAGLPLLLEGPSAALASPTQDRDALLDHRVDPTLYVRVQARRHRDRR